MRLRILMAGICFLASVQLGGQEAEPCRDYRFRTETDPVFFSSNPASLSGFRGHISMAEAVFCKENGAFIRLQDSPDSYKAGVLTDSYISISDRLAFHGKINWSYFSGSRMGGPVLMDPDYNPVGFYESSFETAGRKIKEDYSLLGALSYRLGEQWSLGFSAEYESADQTKVKDPRFYNVWMDLAVRAGAAFRPSPDLMLGASLIYRSTIEQVRGGIYGTTDKQYFIFTDKGGYLGSVAELAGESNYVPLNNTRPMQNSFFGLGLQVAGKNVSNELEVMYRNGLWGNRASASAVYFDFSGVRAGYKGRFIAASGENLHKFSLDLDYEFLGNNENVFRYVTPAGQNTRVEYSGSNHIQDRHCGNVKAAYVWYRGTDGYRPQWRAGLELEGRGTYRHTVLYPFYRNTSLLALSSEAFAERSFFSGRSIFTVGLRARFLAGTGTPKQDGAYASTSASSLESFDSYLDRQYEYDTAPAGGAGAEFCYTRIISARFAFYARISDDFTSMLKAPRYLDGRIRNVALVAVGCNF